MTKQSGKAGAPVETVDPVEDLTEDEKAVLRKLMAKARSVRTEKTAERSRNNGKKSGGRPKGPGKEYSPEAKEKMSAAQSARWARVREEKAGKEGVNTSVKEETV